MRDANPAVPQKLRGTLNLIMYSSTHALFSAILGHIVLHKRNASDGQVSLNLSLARQSPTRRGQPDVVASVCFVS